MVKTPDKEPDPTLFEDPEGAGWGKTRNPEGLSLEDLERLETPREKALSASSGKKRKRRKDNIKGDEGIFRPHERAGKPKKAKSSKADQPSVLTAPVNAPGQAVDAGPGTVSKGDKMAEAMSETDSLVGMPRPGHNNPYNQGIPPGALTEGLSPDEIARRYAANKDGVAAARIALEQATQTEPPASPEAK